MKKGKMLNLDDDVDEVDFHTVIQMRGFKQKHPRVMGQV